MRRLALPLLAAAPLVGCQPASPAPPDLAFRAPETYYVTTEGARTLFFRTTVHNRTDTAYEVTAFAYAADDVAQPPARGLYPPRALGSMPSDRRYAMGRPDLGQRLTLPARDSAVFEGAIPLPHTWAPTGQPVASDGFRDLFVYLYRRDSRTLASQHWVLRRIRGDAPTSAAPAAR